MAEPVVVGIVVGQGVSREMAERLSGELPEALRSRFGRGAWNSEVVAVQRAEPNTRELGNIRQIVGMVRANQPTRVIARLSAALVGALGTGSVALASQNVWQLADGMSSTRLALLALLSIAATCLALVLAHGLWERAEAPQARERVIVFNVATLVTLLVGVVSLYLAPFLVTLVGAGALGSVVEGDVEVREATYRNREDDRTESATDAGEQEEDSARREPELSSS